MDQDSPAFTHRDDIAASTLVGGGAPPPDIPVGEVVAADDEPERFRTGGATAEEIAAWRAARAPAPAPVDE